MILEVTEGTFEQSVIARSREVPVVVDFWAEWCGPCRALTPALERAATAREGDVDLAKVDVDSNQRLAQTFRVQGIPAVKAFRDGAVAAEFTGAVPPAEVERFFDRLVPSRADRLAAAGDEASLRAALDLEPGHAESALALGRILLARGETEEALAILERFPQDFVAAGLVARSRLSANGSGEEDLGPAFRAWDDGDHGAALEGLQAAFVATGEADRRDLIRRTMIGIFTELGPDDALVRDHRRRLASALY